MVFAVIISTAFGVYLLRLAYLNLQRAKQTKLRISAQEQSYAQQLAVMSSQLKQINKAYNQLSEQINDRNGEIIFNKNKIAEKNKLLKQAEEAKEQLREQWFLTQSELSRYKKVIPEHEFLTREIRFNEEEEKRKKKEAEEKRQREILEKARREAEEQRQQEERRKREEAERVKRDQAERLKREAEERRKREAEERLKREAEEKRKREERKRQFFTTLQTRPRKANSSAFAEVLEKHKIKKLYHFTDKSNLPSIKEQGGLLSWWTAQELGISVSKPGGDALSKELDSKYNLQDYVRLSFIQKHPMMFVALNDGRISNPCILEIDLEVCYWEGTKFSDMNATRNGHSCGETLADLNKIHFNTIKQPNHFGLTDEEKPYYQAEVLVKSFLPISSIKNI